MGGASTLMALITAVGASAFLGRIATTLCLEQGLCQMAMEAVQDILDDIDENESESMYIISKQGYPERCHNPFIFNCFWLHYFFEVVFHLRKIMSSSI